MGNKIIDIETLRDASRGRKSKAGGRGIKSDSVIYTPGRTSIEKKVHKTDEDQISSSNRD